MLGAEEEKNSYGQPVGSYMDRSNFTNSFNMINDLSQQNVIPFNEKTEQVMFGGLDYIMNEITNTSANPVAKRSTKKSKQPTSNAASNR